MQYKDFMWLTLEKEGVDIVFGLPGGANLPIYDELVEKRITKGRSIKEFVVACVYVACWEMNIPRTLDEIAEIANADKVFAGKCYRLLLRNLKIRLT